MTRGDQVVESAADRLEAIVRSARRSGGIKAKAADALADDPAFLRKLKPSLVAARVRGQALPPARPAEPQLERPTLSPATNGPKNGGSTSPWLVLGAALAAGYVLAKAIDWRGHAHPRR